MCVVGEGSGDVDGDRGGCDGGGFLSVLLLVERRGVVFTRTDEFTLCPKKCLLYESFTKESSRLPVGDEGWFL